MAIIAILFIIMILAIAGVSIIQIIRTTLFNRKWEKQRETLDGKIATLKEKKKYVRYLA